MTGLRNLRAIINESFIRIKGRQGKERRCECALNCCWGFRGWGTASSDRGTVNREKTRGKKVEKMEKGGEKKGRKKKKRSPSNFQITAKNKAKAVARGGAGRGEHGEVKPHQRQERSE